MKRLFIVLFISCLLFLSGCTYMLEKEYISISNHTYINNKSNLSSKVFVISDYDTLCQTLLTTVKNHGSDLSTQLVDYPGNVEADVQDAIQYIMTSPIGAYGINNISFENTLILNHYEINFNFTYDKSIEQFFEIQEVSSISQLRAAIKEGLKNFNTEIALKLNNVDINTLNLNDNVIDIYYANPLYALGLTDYTINYYPEKSSDCVVELILTYKDSYTSLTTKHLQTLAALEKIVSAYEGDNQAVDLVKYFHDTLCSTCAYVEPSADYNAFTNITPEDTFTPYGALVLGTACGEGYALAMQALCDYYDISCMRIEGSIDGLRTVWNMVYLWGHWYHIDSSADYIGEQDIIGYGSFCVTDKILSAYYVWPELNHGYCFSATARDYYELPPDTMWLSRYNMSGLPPQTSVTVHNN